MVAREVAAQAHGARLLWVSVTAAPDGPPGRRRELRALHVCPTARMWALPAWRATVEGVWEEDGVTVTWCSHEVEKGVRGLLRQSHWSLEWLAAPRWRVGDGGEALEAWRRALEELAPSGVHAGAVATYRAMARGFREAGGAEASWAATRHTLTGLRLAREGVLSADPASLARWAGEQGGALGELGEPARWSAAVLGEVEGRWERGGGVLPPLAPGYEALSAYLVRLRLEGLRGGW